MFTGIYFVFRRLTELKMNEILTSFVRSRINKKTISEDDLQSFLTEQHMKFEENILKNNSLKHLAVTGELDHYIVN